MRRLIKFLIACFYKVRFLRKCSISATTSVVLRGCNFEGQNSLGRHIYISNTSMGYGSYTGFSCEFSNCIIGRYCSIGNYVRVVSATHPTEMVSTHPSFYSSKFKVSYIQKDAGIIEHLVTEKGYECEIGNDVWIGDNVLIKGGVSIGDGAIVAMGSVVLHNVAPYTIVAGVPAKVVRKRFDDRVIENLRMIRWWEKPLNWIKDHAEDFKDPEGFMQSQGH